MGKAAFTRNFYAAYSRARPSARISPNPAGPGRDGRALGRAGEERHAAPWQPMNPGLIADLERDQYFKEAWAPAT
jgi:hypothetical protein